MRMKQREMLEVIISLRIFQTALLCLFTINPWMYWFWKWRSTWGHVSGSVKLHIKQEMEGKRACPKNVCLRSLPMYWPVRNLMRQVFCESMMVGFFQKFVESSESMFAFDVYFFTLEIWFSIGSRLLLWSSFLRYLSRKRMGPLSGVAAMEGQSSFWK